VTWEGKVEALHTASDAAAPMTSVASLVAVPGKGIEGDRYFKKKGTFSGKVGPRREVTLIAAEALEALAREHGISLEARESRRNVLVRGVPLNELIGRTFSLGEVVLEGLDLCEPCAHLSKLAGKPLQRGLGGRGGLRARVVTGGTIRVGDLVRPTA
jgi:MOSC domain-containing protein YiiM